jgi:hypothetical protein
MRVRADDRADAAVEIPAEGHLFAGGFRMHIDDDRLHGAGELFDDPIGGVKGAVRPDVHIGTAEDAEHRHGRTVAGLDDGDLRADRFAREIRRAQDALLLLQQRDRLAPLVHVVAHRADVDAVVAQLREHVAGETAAGGRVFGVGNYQIELTFANQAGHNLGTDMLAGFPDDIPDDQKSHADSF